MAALATFAVLAAPLAGAQTFPDGAYNPFGHSPILVLVDAANLTSADGGYAGEVRAAERFWEEGGDGALQFPVSFQETGDRRQADVVLWFLDSGRVDATCDDDEAALGCTLPFERPVSIELLARSADGNYRSYQQVREIAEHELGHALGLPHSPNPDDIMYGTASIHAAQSWRPGDLAPLLAGTGALLAILGLVGVVLVRAMRPTEELGRILPWTGADCGATADGRHAVQEAEIDTPRGRETWDVCVACRRGRPRG
jgi:hypothetical protein